MQVRIDPNRQLALLQRKRLAARLLGTICSDRYALSEEELIESIDANSFCERLETEINAQIAKNEQSPDRDDVSLIEVLRRICETVSEEGKSAGSGSEARVLRERLQKSLRQFDCQVCGNEKDEVCNGFTDQKMLEGENGALCLQFVLELVRKFAEVAQRRYSALFEEEVFEKKLPALAIENVLCDDRVAGDFGVMGLHERRRDPMQNGAEDVLRLQWVGTAYNLGVLSLPYVVFHELFVHWPQGINGTEVVYSVPTDCSFTEGAVAAVSLDVLMEALLVEENLPETLKPLRRSFETQARKYHERRMEFTPASDPAEFEDPTYQIAQARFYGTRGVYDYLGDLYRRNGRDKARETANKIIVWLNTHLTREQRSEIYESIKALRSQCPKWLDWEILGLFDKYLTDGKPDNLLKNMEELIER